MHGFRFSANPRTFTALRPLAAWAITLIGAASLTCSGHKGGPPADAQPASFDVGEAAPCPDPDDASTGATPGSPTYQPHLNGRDLGAPDLPDGSGQRDGERRGEEPDVGGADAGSPSPIDTTTGSPGQPPTVTDAGEEQPPPEPPAMPCLMDGHCVLPSDKCLEGTCVEGECFFTPLHCPSDGTECPIICHPSKGCHPSGTVWGIPCGHAVSWGHMCYDKRSCWSGGSCVLVNPKLTCDDGNPCTTNPPCKTTGPLAHPCDHVPLPDWTPCDDADPCTQEACVDGVCQVLHSDCPCDLEVDTCEEEFGDGNLCNGVSVCMELPDGVGCATAPGSEVKCNPAQGTPCMPHQCNPETGACELTIAAAGTPCNDADMCTKDDVCDGAGKCLGTPLSCEDGDPCTADRCVHGECVNELKDCFDGDPWTLDVCEPSGCSNPPSPNNPFACETDADCPSSSCCTSVCQLPEGVCLPGPTPLSCCCVNDAQCDDGNPCTVNTCASGKLTSKPATCCGGCESFPVPGCCVTAADCNDGNLCTEDSCKDNACTHTPIPGCQ